MFPCVCLRQSNELKFVKIPNFYTDWICNGVLQKTETKARTFTTGVHCEDRGTTQKRIAHSAERPVSAKDQLNHVPVMLSVARRPVVVPR